MKIFLDFETRSFCDLPAHGGWVYSEDPTTDVFCMAYYCDGMKSPRLYVPPWVTVDKKAKSEFTIDWEVPKIFFDPEAEFVARNALFEYAIVSNICIPRYGFPESMRDVDKWYCTRAMCVCLGLPASLEMSAKVLRVETQKLEVGNYLINTYSKPLKNKKTGELSFRELTAACLLYTSPSPRDS